MLSGEELRTRCADIDRHAPEWVMTGADIAFFVGEYGITLAHAHTLRVLVDDIAKAVEEQTGCEQPRREILYRLICMYARQSALDAKAISRIDMGGIILALHHWGVPFAAAGKYVGTCWGWTGPRVISAAARLVGDERAVQLYPDTMQTHLSDIRVAMWPGMLAAAIIGRGKRKCTVAVLRRFGLDPLPNELSAEDSDSIRHLMRRSEER